MLRRSLFHHRTGVTIIRTITNKDIATHLSMTPEQLKKFPIRPDEETWAAYNGVVRAQLKAFLSTCPQKPYLALRQVHRKSIAGDKQKNLVSDSGVIADWKTRQFDTVFHLAEHYERIIAPAIDLLSIINKHTLLCYGYRDILKLKRVSQVELDKTKKQLQESESTIQRCRGYLTDYVRNSFDTHIYNSLINVFRICGETDHHSNTYAQRLLDDMTKLQVPFDLATQQLLRSVCFGDEMGEDSDMLFAFVEYPETGEVTLRHEDVKTINQEIVETVAQRHNIELTSTGVHKFDSNTFPMLARK